MSAAHATTVGVQAIGIPLLVAWCSIALGAIIAWVPGLGPRALGPLRTIAFILVTVVVVFHLLPNAWGDIGAMALAGMIAGLLAPILLQRVAESFVLNRSHPLFEEHCDTLAVQIGYVGLLVHGVADGAALWLIQQQPGDNLRASIALAAHNVPIAAMVAMQFSQSSGHGVSLLRTAGLALACTAGILAADTAFGGIFPSIEPWVASVVSGLLLHVVTHQLQDAWPRFLSARKR